MPEQVGALPAGPSTDTLVARTIFGMVVKATPEGPVCKRAGDPADVWTPVRPYSTDDAAADAIVARFRRRFQFREIRDGSEWVVFFGFFADKDGVPTIKIIVQVRAATRPLAICEAGLVLVDKLAQGLT
jgi:hypothetical protein